MLLWHRTLTSLKLLRSKRVGITGGFPTDNIHFRRAAFSESFRCQKRFRSTSTSSKDYYEVLNVKKDSSQQEIKKAYLKLAQKFHPDVYKGSGSKEKFQEISNAFETLSNQKKRVVYDTAPKSQRYDAEYKAYQRSNNYSRPDYGPDFNGQFYGRTGSQYKYQYRADYEYQPFGHSPFGNRNSGKAGFSAPPNSRVAYAVLSPFVMILVGLFLIWLPPSVQVHNGSFHVQSSTMVIGRTPDQIREIRREAREEARANSLIKNVEFVMDDKKEYMWTTMTLHPATKIEISIKVRPLVNVRYLQQECNEVNRFCRANGVLSVFNMISHKGKKTLEVTLACDQQNRRAQMMMRRAARELSKYDPGVSSTIGFWFVVFGIIGVFGRAAPMRVRF
eukprot:645936_1